jgi:glyoxylase-like metal-dependent hydrolase (beta-lactamase superfamily II)
MRDHPFIDNSTPRLSRRWFLAGTAALALPLPRGAAWALATDTVSVMQGDTEVIVLSDGFLTLPTGVLAPTAPKEELEALLTVAYGSVPEALQPATNVTLLRTGSDLILLDNGSGKNFQPSAGKLLDNLALNEIDPASITKVVFTHGHPDHVWGTLRDDGSLTFPNAAYYVGANEWNFWMDPDILTKLPAEMHPFALGAQRDFGAVKDRVSMVKDGDSIAPGVSVLDTPGHTPGHIALLVEGGGGLIVSGDAVAHAVVSMAHPEWAFGFDSVPDQAAATRRAMLDRIASERLKMLAYHFDYPGIGRVEKTEAAFRFVAEI